MTTVEFTAIDKSLVMLAFEGCDLAVRLASWTKETFGGRCEEQSEGCPCCNAWAVVDSLMNVVEGLE